jgi:hypothetical protein
MTKKALSQSKFVQSMSISKNAPKTLDEFVDVYRTQCGSIDRYWLQALYDESRFVFAPKLFLGWYGRTIQTECDGKPVTLWLTRAVEFPGEQHARFYATAMDRRGYRYIVRWNVDAPVSCPTSVMRDGKYMK